MDFGWVGGHQARRWVDGGAGGLAGYWMCEKIVRRTTAHGTREWASKLDGEHCQAAGVWLVARKQSSSEWASGGRALCGLAADGLVG